MQIGVILAGGCGSRFRSKLPKQYATLAGKEMIAYSVEAMQEATSLDAFFVVGDRATVESGRLTAQYGVPCIVGGDSRNASLAAALRYIRQTYGGCSRVFIHEAARPFLTSQLVDAYLALLDDYDAVITTKPVTDSLGKYGAHVIDRSEYYLIQAPEAFRFELLASHFDPDSEITATIQQLPETARVKHYTDFVNNYKVTFPEDLPLYELLMQREAKH